MRSERSKVVAWVVALAIAVPFTAQAQAPVQRPSGLRDAAPQGETPQGEVTPTDGDASGDAGAEAGAGADAEAEAGAGADAGAAARTEAGAEGAPELDGADGGRVEGDVVGAPVERAVPQGRIAGVVVDTEQAGVGVPDARIAVACPCLSEPIVVHADYDGRFSIDELPTGTYTLQLDRGGRITKRVVSIADGQRVRIEVAVAPPTETRELERRAKVERRASTMIATGSVAALAGFVMIVGGIVEANKAPCMFGLDDCSNAPRPAIAKGLGIGGALALAGGAALIGAGVVSRRRLRASIEADATTAALVITGRF